MLLRDGDELKPDPGKLQAPHAADEVGVTVHPVGLEQHQQFGGTTPDHLREQVPQQVQHTRIEGLRRE